MDAAWAVLLFLLVVLLYIVITSVINAFTNPIRTYATEFVSPLPPDEAAPRVTALLQTARRVDLRLLAPTTYEISYRHYPGWSIVIGVLLFPVGLIATFVARQDLRISVAVSAEGTGSRVRVIGRAHKKLAENIGGVLEQSLQGAS